MLQQWLNYILRESSQLYYFKQRLFVVHGFEAAKLLFRIWSRELLLAVTSFPAFLFLRTRKVGLSEQRTYRLRRRVTLAVLIPLLLVWSIRLGIGMVRYSEETLQEFSRGPEPKLSDKVTIPWQQFSSAAQSLRIPAPAVLSSTFSSDLVVGQAPSGTQVLVLFQEDRTGITSLVTAHSDERGNWSVNKSDLKELPSGTYVVSAVTYDVNQGLKSRPSPQVRIKVPPTLEEKLERLTDYLIYGTIGLLIMLAIVMSFLS